MLHYSAKLYNEIGYVNTTENITASADDFENILQTVYPVTFSCYYGVVEYKIASKQYVETVKTPKKILNNLIKNAGKLYDSIFFLVKWVKLDTSVYFTSEQVYNYWYKMGGYIGLMLYLALYNFGSLAVWSITNANTTTKNATITKF